MELHVFATGSKGNCYVLKDNAGKMLMLDCGVPMQAVYRAVDFNTTALDACLCGHYHSDHLKAAKDMLKAYMPVYMTGLTAELGKIDRHSPTLHICREDDQLKIGNWRVVPFSLEHDVPNSGFIIAHQKEQEQRISYISDTGFVKYNPQGISTYIIEANYINELLKADADRLHEEGDRFLRSYEYHMSLERLLSYLSKVDLSNLKNIVLVHMSDRYSDENRMIEEVKRQTGVSVYAAHAGDVIPLDEVPF